MNSSLLKVNIIFILFCLSFSLKGQSHIRLMIGETKEVVSEYLDSLNKLSNNRAYKIEKDISEEGDLILKVGFSIFEEKKYGCLGIFMKFQRTKFGAEICVEQRVWGSVEYSEKNISFIKDTFSKNSSDNFWEKQIFIYQTEAWVLATIERVGETNPNYFIKYRLFKKNK